MADIADITGKNFKSGVLDRKGVTVVRFWATWCGPCVRTKPIYHEVAGELADQAGFAEVDIDRAPEVADAVGIRSVPTVVVFKDGEPVDGVVGGVAKGQLVEKIQAHL